MLGACGDCLLLVALIGPLCVLPWTWRPSPRVPKAPAGVACSNGLLSKSTGNRSRRGPGSWLCSLPFHVPHGSCQSGLPAPKGLRSPCCVKKILHVKIQRRDVNQPSEPGCQDGSCSNRLNFAPPCVLQRVLPTARSDLLAHLNKAGRKFCPHPLGRFPALARRGSRWPGGIPASLLGSRVSAVFLGLLFGGAM